MLKFEDMTFVLNAVQVFFTTEAQRAQRLFYSQA